jgi:hypothetical protein
VVEGQLLRKVLGLKWGEVAGQWRKLCNEDIQDLRSSPR